MIDKYSKLFKKQMKDHFNAEISALRSQKTIDSDNLFPQDNIKKAYKKLKQGFAIKENSSFYNPEIIHIVGSNGKGSTAFYLEQELEKNKKTVGLFTSPHLLEIAERFRINANDLSYLDLYNSYNYLKELLSLSVFQNLSFFDLTFLMAMESFFRKKVEYIILEAGLGGRLDSTRQAAGRFVLLTSISKEHTNFLGNSKKKIAKEKMMIIHPKQESHFFYRPDSFTSLNRIQDIISSSKKNRKYFLKTNFHYLLDEKIFLSSRFPSPSLLPSIKENYFLAKLVIDFLLSYKENELSPKKIYYSYLTDYEKSISPIPLQLLKGRSELYSFKKYNCHLAFDGAHNPASIKKLLDDMLDYFDKRKEKVSNTVNINIYCSIQKDKNKKAIKRIFKKIQKKLDQNIFLSFTLEYLTSRENDFTELSFLKKWKNLKATNSCTQNSDNEVLNKQNENYFLICGSFRLYSDFIKLKGNYIQNLGENPKREILWSYYS